MSSFACLVDDHDAIVNLSRSIERLCDAERPDLDEITARLEQLAGLVRDHLDREDGVIYETVEASIDTPHAATAREAAVAFERLKQDWGSYLYRWDRPHITTRWSGFVAETRAMLIRLVDRVEWETAILYSLAVHHGIVMPTR